MSADKKEYQKTLDYIYKEIKKGNLRLGDKLPTERYLSQTLSIGRGSIREALRMLENIGMIESRQGSGNYLTGKVSGGIMESMRLMLMLNQTTTQDIQIFRKNFEKAVCISIIEKGLKANWKNKLHKILAEARACQDTTKRIKLDKEFHETLIYATENPLWISTGEAIVELYQKDLTATLKKTENSVKMALHLEHLSILSTLEKGNRQACEQAIDRHYGLIERESEKL